MRRARLRDISRRSRSRTPESSPTRKRDLPLPRTPLHPRRPNGSDYTVRAVTGAMQVCSCSTLWRCDANVSQTPNRRPQASNASPTGVQRALPRSYIPPAMTSSPSPPPSPPLPSRRRRAAESQAHTSAPHQYLPTPAASQNSAFGVQLPDARRPALSTFLPQDFQRSAHDAAVHNAMRPSMQLLTPPTTQRATEAHATRRETRGGSAQPDVEQEGNARGGQGGGG